MRALMTGRMPEFAALHLAVILGYAALGYFMAIHFARKRFSA